MQWSCPHCGSILAVTDDTLGTGWSFSRCYKCGGFALIRKAEVNVIKVDKAPPGEKVILPEASPDPTIGLMSEKATQKVAKYMTPSQTGTAKAPPPRFSPQPQSSLQIHSSQAQSSLKNIQSQASVKSSPVHTSQKLNSTQNPPHLGLSDTFDISSAVLPEPLPEIPNNPKSKVIPFGILTAAFLTFSSGIYLYNQGQALWVKARLSGTKSVSAVTPNELSETKNVVAPPSLLADDMPSENDLNEKQRIVATQDAKPPVPHVVITDQVQQSAMAPLKPPSSNGMNSGGSMSITPGTNHGSSVAPSRSQEAADKSVNIAASTPFLVKIRSKKANLYSGPGTHFPVTGIANPDAHFQVTEWNNHWFKVTKLTQNPGTSLNQPTGWIQNDLVQVIKN